MHHILYLLSLDQIYLNGYKIYNSILNNHNHTKPEGIKIPKLILNETQYSDQVIPCTFHGCNRQQYCPHDTDGFQLGWHQYQVDTTGIPVWHEYNATLLGFYRYGNTDTATETNIQQTNTDTYTPFQNLYQTDTDICFEIHIKPIPIPIIGIYLY